MLDTVERGDALQRLYCAARLPPLQVGLPVLVCLCVWCGCVGV